MHFDGFNSMEGRHLVFAYAAVLLIQGGYAAWIALQYHRLRQNKKAPKPLS